MLPDCYYPRKVVRVHRIGRPPLLQFFKRPTKVIEHPAVDVLDLTLGRHDRDETRNRLNGEARPLFTALEGFLGLFPLGDLHLQIRVRQN